MALTLTTPALLFPALSLLLLAYTNRFLTIATLIRGLHSQYRDDPSQRILLQIKNLRLRVRLIRDMQFLGIMSLLLCVLCMFMLFKEWLLAARYTFAVSLMLMIGSLAVSAWEIYISVQAISIELSSLEDQSPK
ncbi:Protein of unknown function [Catalinimonas alkaloidigena]|uniref:II family cellulose-binding protein n=1 Tax=Catalinimonas alkaloidigena TaxID=1075417 RepID=A0A1G9B0D9_9BACT|nr:DUF2721 domain-containing protein [Catalinimonas alkaloidigena]SDK33046.1 Protein of unknown function [Catalinimonas alkaloidigena]